MIVLILFFIPAEKFLESVEGNKNYPKLLLHLVNKPDCDLTIRIAGAVAFKNLIKRNWSIVCYISFILFFFLFIKIKK